MRKDLYPLRLFVALFVLLSTIALFGQTPVQDWGFIGGRNGGWGVSVGTPGNVTASGTVAPNGWMAVRGQFPSAVTATQSDAIVITGSIEFVNAGITNWSGLRYGFFRHDSAGVLEHVGTDSVRWSGSEANASGYMVTPHSGVNDQVSWANGGNGTQGVTRNGNWISTFGNNLALGVIEQRPFRSEATAGTYDFAFSLQPQADGTNELRYYFIKNDNSYWIGGTLTDTTAITDTFNGVCFAIRSDNSDPDFRALNVNNVTVDLGAPITIPAAPFSAFYVDQWGFVGGRIGGWNLTPGTVIGNATASGSAPPNGWMAVRGGFPGSVTATNSEALIITGSLEFVGAGPTNWSGLRYGFFYHDSIGSLEVDTSTVDSNMVWSGSEAFANGYMFTPHSGVNDQVSWANGGNGTQGVTRFGNWISTFGNNLSMGVIAQQPARAEATAGTYNFAFSLQPQADGTNEVRYYIVKDDNSYWTGGILSDTTAVTDQINGVCFAIRGENGEPTYSALNIYDLYVDLGQPITIPDAPFSAFYVDQWGFIGGRIGGWNLTNGAVIGNATASGSAAPNGWMAVRGGFPAPVKANTSEAILVSGKLEFVGGGPSIWSGLRFGLFEHDSVGVLVVDTSTVDSNLVWSGSEAFARGYMFTPHSGVNDQVSWANGGNGTQGVTRNGNWISTFGNNLAMGVINQKPARAEATAGLYDFAFAVQPLADGTNDVYFYFIKDDNSYWYGGMVNDTTGITDTFTGVCIAIRSDNGEPAYSALNIVDLYIDRGTPFNVPKAPWTAYYVDKWGFIGGRTGGWDFVPGTVIGNGGMSGANPVNGVAAMRAELFEPLEITADTAVVITGVVEFVGGGFEDVTSFRYGAFMSDSAGSLVDSIPEQSFWNGTEDHSYGYLFVPRSGNNDHAEWANGVMASQGAIVDDPWLETMGPDNFTMGQSNQLPDLAVGSAGVYNFSMSFGPIQNGYMPIHFNLIKDDDSYTYSDVVRDDQASFATTFINSLNFATANPTTTGLFVRDLLIDLGDPIPTVVGIEEVPDAPVPQTYALDQNYPNPFNPSTTIRFRLPEAQDIKLVVYDVTGRVVSEVVNNRMAAGEYKITFDGQKLASGVYFYRLSAGNFVATRKFILLK